MTEQFIKNINLFLTVLEARKFNIRVPVSDEGLFATFYGRKLKKARECSQEQEKREPNHLFFF